MDIAALLSPASIAKTVDGGAESTSSKAGGDVFAPIFAAALGQASNPTNLAPEAATAAAAVSVMPVAVVPFVSSPALAVPVVLPPVAVASATPGPNATAPLAPAPTADLPEVSAGDVVDAPVSTATSNPTVSPLATVPPSASTDVPTAVPESTPALSVDPTASDETGGKPADPKTDDVPKLAVDTGVEAPAKGSKRPSPKEPNPHHTGPPPHQVDAPPDPPPSKAVPEKGALTETPNASVEGLDPNSETDEALALPADPSAAPTVLLSTVPMSAVPVPTILVAPTASKALAAPVAAVVSAPQTKGNAPKASGLPTRANTSIASAQVEDETAVTSDGSLSPLATFPDANFESVPSTDQTTEPDASPISIPAAAKPPTAGSESTPIAAPVLASAPDLGVVPQVVVATNPSATVAPIVGVRAVPNAEVARVVADRPATKISETVDKPVVATKDASATVLLEAGASSNGEDAPPDDSPKDEAPTAPTPTPPAASTARSAATDRPDAGTDRPSVDRHLVVRQVADRIESLVASRPKDGVVVHLEPRDLGTITLVVKGLQSALDVQVTASDDRVRQSLDASRPELAQALAPRGLELRELRIANAPSTPNPNSTGSSNSNSNGGNPNPEDRARPQNPSPTFTKASRTESTEARTTRSRPNGRGVDVLV